MNSPPTRRFPFLASGIFGALGVALGALGAHWLESFLAPREIHTWETAARYHVVHAIALLGAAVWERQARQSEIRWALWSARFWSLGIVLFSGSLYWLALGGPRWLGPITPFGGLAFLAGWFCVAVAAFSKNE